MQRASLEGPPAWRAARFWQPSIVVRRGEGGVLYVEQKEPLPACPRRITESLIDWAERVPDRTLFADRGGGDGGWRRLTYRAAVDGMRRLGQFLLDAGLSHERPLAILSGNDIDHALLALAAIHVGVPYAAISPAYSLVSKDFARLRSVFDTLRPGMVFAAEAEPFAAALAAVADAALPRLFARGAARSEEDFASALATVAGPAVEAAFEATGPDTVAKFLFTSGSTGAPKAVVNTQRMLCANQVMTRETFTFLKDEPPVLLDWAPWHHTAGGNKLFFMAPFNGGTLHIDDGNPTPAGIERTVRNLREVSPHWYFNVPKGFEALVPHLERDEAARRSLFRDLKMLWYAGAGMAQHTWDALDRLAVETVGERIVIATGLGATETAPVALMCTWPQERAGNVGLPCHGVSLKLVPLDGKLDARIRGPNVTPGYRGAPELTAAAFDEEGYYRLGDALRLADADDIAAGFLFDGRTAENFKLDTGTWVSVGALRTRFVDHFGAVVRDVAIAGADRPCLAALVFPEIGALRKVAGLGDEAPPEALFSHPEVVGHFRDRLEALASEATGSSTRIERLMLADPPPSLDSGELTDKGSLNQRAVLANRAALVEELYSGSPRVIAL